MSWLPEGFRYPARVDVPGGEYYLRPIRESDVDLDYPAVMGSRDRLWSLFGEAWGWPPETMTLEQDRADLASHVAEMVARQSYNYAIFDVAQTALLGCVYIDPPGKIGADAEISWWVVDELAGSGLDDALEELVPAWIAREWPFTQPRYLGRDISWQRWLELPDAPEPPGRPD